MNQQSTTLFNNAELALASYANLAQGSTGTRTTDLFDAGMSVKQANEFALRYPTIVTQFNDTPAEGGMGTSFSATVFKDGLGNVTIAIRGTAQPNDFVPTDANIAVNGAGYDQIVAMYNWSKKASSPAGQLVDQFRLVAYAPTQTPPVSATFLYPGTGVLWFLESAPRATATGYLLPALASDPDGKADITGHSLGGHLAMAFNKLFPSITNQVTIFNSPGFTDTTTNQQFFSRMGGVVPMPFNSGNVTNEVKGTGVEFFSRNLMIEG